MPDQTPTAEKASKPALSWRDGLKSKEAAQMLRVSERTLFSYRQKGLVPFLKINARKFLYFPEMIVDTLKKN